MDGYTDFFSFFEGIYCGLEGITVGNNAGTVQGAIVYAAYDVRCDAFRKTNVVSVY
jgi:hypothetical protein|tara:strand:+ start:130 stop:297 length:168 start_codon:yes stop_codon:yes gene_type:complete